MMGINIRKSEKLLQKIILPYIGLNGLFLFFQLIHFLMEKKFSIFRKNNFEAVGKVPLSCGSLLVYVETRRGCPINWGECVWSGGGTVPFAVPYMAGIE